MKVKMPSNVGIADSAEKANPVLSHKYIPDVDYSPISKELGKLKREDKPYVICRHFTEAGKAALPYDHNRQGALLVDIFLSQVDEVHGLEHPTEDRDLTKEELVYSQSNPIFTAFIIDTARHVIAEGELTEKQVKN